MSLTTEEKKKIMIIKRHFHSLSVEGVALLGSLLPKRDSKDFTSFW